MAGWMVKNSSLFLASCPLSNIFFSSETKEWNECDSKTFDSEVYNALAYYLHIVSGKDCAVDQNLVSTAK